MGISKKSVSSGGGITWSTAVNADIVSDGDGTRDVGSYNNRFAEGYFSYQETNNIDFGKASAPYDTQYGGMGGNGTSLDADVFYQGYLANGTGALTYGLHFKTEKPMKFSTGNNGSGDSGGLEFSIGTATGTQGNFKFLKSGVAPFVGDVFTCTGTDGSGYWSLPLDPHNYVTFYEDLTQNSGIGQLTSTKAGTASQVALENTNDANHPGMMSHSTGTDTTGYATSYAGRHFLGGALYYETSIKLSALSDGTDTYALTVGFSDGVAGINPQNGFYFYYASGTSANWLMSASNGGTRTQTASSTAVTTNWTRLALEVNSARDTATFYVNGTSIGTVTTNFPGTSTLMYPVVSILKSAGTNSRTCYLDYVFFRIAATR